MTDWSKPFGLKQYEIMASPHVHALVVHAESPGRARVKAWHRYQTAYPETSYGQFLRRSSLKRTPQDQISVDLGRKILVGGAPAYLISASDKEVRFVRPGETQILYSHPLDVDLEPETRKDAA